MSYKVQAQKLNAAGAVISRVTKLAGPAARSMVVKLSKGRYKFRVAAGNDAGPYSAWSKNSNIVRGSPTALRGGAVSQAPVCRKVPGGMGLRQGRQVVERRAAS